MHIKSDWFNRVNRVKSSWYGLGGVRFSPEIWKYFSTVASSCSRVEVRSFAL